jgi:signal transduction histidine kinase/PAS domain-containing protein
MMFNFRVPGHRNGLFSMGQFEKPNGGSAGAGNRETLAKLARLISAPDESVDADTLTDDNEETLNENPYEETLSLTSLRVPGAAQLLEALPAGLAVCEGARLIKANSAFALAFGYRSADQLEEAGGLETVFPTETKALAKHLKKRSDAEAKAIKLKARSRSGREFRVPVAIHPITAEGDEKASLLILHPHTSALPKTSPAKSTPKVVDVDTANDNQEAKTQKAGKRQKNKGGEKSRDRADSIVHLNKTDFLAKVSHEVRTPLNSIIGFAELMKEEQLGPIGNDRYRGYIRDIHESGLYALSLVNDLLDISKIEAGEFELNFTAVDLEEVAVESVHSMEPQARRQRVLLRTSFAEDMPDVLADRRSIKQIILNLLSNAIKFTKPGGQVIVSTQRTNSGGVRLRVRDSGIGMTDGEISVALKPFQQVDTAPRKQLGTGLGLPLTKALVEANQAKFKLRSISDSGTRIDVTFPVKRVANAKD